MRIRQLVVLLGVALVWPHLAAAQLVMRPRAEVTTPVDGGGSVTSRSTTRLSVKPARDPGNDPVDPLTQVSVQASGDDATARVQAMTLFLSPKGDRLRFYVNSQLPLRTEDTSEAPAEGEKPSPSDYLKSQLLDDHGGLINLSFGHYGKLKGGVLGSVYSGDDNHGLILDARSGVKLIELPEQDGGTNDSFLRNISPFWANNVTLSFSVPLYSETVAGDARTAAGGLVLALSVSNNYAAEQSFTTAFNTELKRSLTTAKVHLAVTVLKLGDIVLSGTLHSNDPVVNRKILLSFNARR
jgi:hypothetical protein